MNSVVVLVLANLVPVIGVLFLGWDVATILVLYWIENGIVGLLNIPKILLARGALNVAIPAMAQFRARTPTRPGSRRHLSLRLVADVAGARAPGLTRSASISRC